MFLGHCLSTAGLNVTSFSVNSMYLCMQNPKEADAMTKLQTDLDETKIILVRTV